MATKTKPQTTAVANWDEELAKQAQTAAGLTNSSEGGKFFSTQAGVLSYDDAPLPGNQMVAIIGAWCLENVYYEGKFDKDNRTPPACFAFCKDPDAKLKMEPHEDVDKVDVFERQSDDCESCPQNQWGSADTGRGKACGNRRRLALIPGGTYISQGKGKGFEMELFDDNNHFRTADVGFLKVPVMSGKAFDAYVKSVAEQFKRPVHAVFTRIWLEPDPKSQFKICFELIDQVPDELIRTLMDRHADLYKNIDFPYRPMTEEDKPAAPARKASSNAKLAKGKPAPKAAAKGRR